MNSAKESSIKIYFTSVYGNFKHITGNRDLDEKKINKIIASVKAGNDHLKYNPILVDSDMRIIDG